MPDTSGLNINAVGTPITGMTAWAPKGTALPTVANMANAAFTLPAAYARLGLRTSDGAPEWAESPSAPIDLYEMGYKINPGTGALEVTQTFAQYDDTFRAKVRGAVVTTGVMDVDIDTIVEGVLFTEDTYRMADGTFKLLRKVAPAKIVSVKMAKNARGAITGTTVTWTVDRSPELGNVHFREAWVGADTTPDPVIWNVTPAGLSVGGVMVIQGANFTGMTAVTVGGTAATVKSVANDGTVLATIPAGVTAGAKDVIVTTPNGASPAFSYTVV
jgi:hypothetical protein